MYWVNVTFTIDAPDYETAELMAKAICESVDAEVEDSNINDIEEVV